MSRKLWALVSSLLLVCAGLALSVAPAQAATSNTVTATTTCSSVTFTNNSSTASVSVQYGSDSVTSHALGTTPDIAPGTSYTVSQIPNYGSWTQYPGPGGYAEYWPQGVQGDSFGSFTVPYCDATGSVTVSKATCKSAGVATDSVKNAKLQGSLDETPGMHTAIFVANTGHEFSDGTTTKTVSYTIPAKLTGSQCATSGSTGGSTGSGGSGGSSTGSGPGGSSGSSSSSGGSGRSSTTVGASSGAPETGVSSEASPLNWELAGGLFGICVIGLMGVAFWWRRQTN